MLGQYMSRAQNPDPQKIADVRTGRDFFADMRLYPRSEITEAASAFVNLMSSRIRTAATIEERQAVQRELIKVSRGCLASAKDELRRFQEAAPDTATGQVIPTQPMVTQPYTTQPLILDPVVPAQ